jgi:hypothetical protein
MCAKKCKTKCGKGKCGKSCNSAVVTTTQTIKATLPTPPTSAMASGVAVQVAGLAPTAPTISITDPAAAIKDYGAEFTALYTQYSKLRQLAMPLNGLPQDRRLPDNLKVSRVIVEFTVDGVEHSAEISGVTMIAEISTLIGNGLRTVIDRMYQTLFTLDHVTKTMQTAVQNAIAPKTTPTLKANNDEKAV